MTIRKSSYRSNHVLRLSTIAVLFLAGGCSGDESRRVQEPPSLQEIGEEPDRFPIGYRFSTEGWLIKPPRSVLFICDEISDHNPPKAVGSCSEVENEDVLGTGRLVTRKGTSFLREPVALVCEVTDYAPGDVDPERVVLRCKRRSSSL